MGLLDGKKGLILNIANDRSIAAHIGKQVVAQGGAVGLGFLQIGDSLEKSERRARRGMEELGFTGWLHQCDVTNDASMETFFNVAREKFGTIDFLVHSLAFADKSYLSTKEGVFTSTPREVFRQALDISAYSLIHLSRLALPLMSGGGSIIALTYLGSEKAVPGYNIMGVAKAALESTARYLAYDLGPKNIRVNTISAGPIKTLAASAVGDLDEMLSHAARKAPLKRNIDADEVGKTAVYLLSDLSSGVTGETLYCDAGFNTVGL